ncbi:nucleotidyltransferase domain-containing protein [Jannaschia sp. W003]|uniref:nucleotidyltransferase domain-containing protein n=1 Tax=Jannaschia sp. W003 TaxID=2867012 RepID=UPI0021A41EBA|nr:nucleotidyltransferase domain-containing protein [Jannaschia sp. W003]UWQ20919.1 nucleotidyltransferase domain-containing protein [Jannaschia sp. W003]
MKAGDVIETIAEALRGQPAVRALFLSGSHGNGRADAWSDIDFILVSPDGPSDAVAALWHEAVARTGEIVLWRDRTVRPALVNAITADWTRTDAVILTPEQVRSHPRSGLVPLLDRDDIHDSLPGDTPAPGVPPARLRYQFEEFLRVLGLLHLAMSRQEYLNGVTGVFHLRTLLIDLLIEENGAPDRGGALHLGRLLTAEQTALVAALPVPAAEREAIVAANLAFARAYLPRARRLAAARGVAWPERLEAATWAVLERSPGIARPYEPER